MDAEALSAILVGILVADNVPADAAASLKVLDKVVANALKPDDKFRTLPGTNETVKLRVRQTTGAMEFLDAVGWVLQPNGDIVLSNPVTARLEAASEAIAIASAQLASMTPTPSTSSSTAKSASQASSSSDWQAKAQIEAEARAKEIAQRAEEDRRKKEQLKKQIAAEQKEARDRPVRASVATHLTRASPAGATGGGKPRYLSSLAEYQKLVGSGQPVVVNYTATWCGPCQAIAPLVEAEAQKFPQVVFAKVDIDENQETASANGIQAVPTFVLFKNGHKVEEVRGANPDAVRGLFAKAAAPS